MSTVLDYFYVGLRKLPSTIWLRRCSRRVVLVEQMKDMRYKLEQDGDILEDRRDKVLHQQTQGEEIISIN